MAILVTVFGVVVALLAVLVAGLLRSHAEILRSLHELGVDLDPDHEPGDSAPARVRATTSSFDHSTRKPAGAVAHDVVGETPFGDAASISIAGAQHATLIAFLTSGCSTCAELWTAFAQPGLRVPGDARLVVVTKGPEAESPARVRKLVPPDIPVVMSTAAWEAYDVPIAPYFAFVDGPSSRVVGEGAAGSWDHLTQMLEQALADAGLSSGRRRRRRGLHGAAREARADARLLAAGIKPGDPSLYPTSAADLLAEPESDD